MICYDRMRERSLDRQGVFEKFGVWPESIPDFLALVGDSADGIPGVPRWGRKSASTLLERYGHLEKIPKDHALWEVRVRGAKGLSASLQEHRDAAKLYKQLATLRRDVPLSENLADLQYRGARKSALSELAGELGQSTLVKRVSRFRST